jgi:hypothetical protein
MPFQFDASAWGSSSREEKMQWLTSALPKTLSLKIGRGSQPNFELAKLMETKSSQYVLNDKWTLEMSDVLSRWVQDGEADIIETRLDVSVVILSARVSTKADV